MKKIAIIGASGHGKVVADIARKNGYDEIVFLDDNEAVKTCGDYPVVGKSSIASNLNCDVIVAIGNAKIREKIQTELEAKDVSIPVLIHPAASLGEHVSIDKGTVVMAGAVINPWAIIGKGVIINTCSSVDHDCRIGDFVHVSVGSHLAGTVTVDDCTWIGIGAVVSNNLHICSDCMIGAGAAVVRDIESAGTYVGIPAKRIK